jgi:hypothetical protein
MLRVHSFMENRSFKVVLGELFSKKTYTENGVIQVAVLSVTLFLVALADILMQVKQSSGDYRVTATKILKLLQRIFKLNNVSSWTRRKGFKISPVAMHICRKQIHNHRDPEIRFNGHSQNTWTNI